jgi:AcrR family transcriptional regulator
MAALAKISSVDGVRRNPGRPKKLTQSMIVDAAIELVDTTGPDGLSMRSLAKQLGVNHATLYNYFDNTDQIQAAAIDRLYSEIPPLPPHSAGASVFLQQLIENLLALRDIQQQHPQAIHAPVGSQAWKTSFARMNAAMRSIREFCDSDEQAWFALHMLMGAVATSAATTRLDTETPLRMQQRDALQAMPIEDKDALIGIVQKYSGDDESQRFVRLIRHAIAHLIPALNTVPTEPREDNRHAH